jgi:hypothetical protein
MFFETCIKKSPSTGDSQEKENPWQVINTRITGTLFSTTLVFSLSPWSKEESV